jgi:uncharacterized protein YdhG (YjbR/CyaY superfamily)
MPEEANKMSARKSGEFSDEEKAAMKARAQELKAEARANKDRAAGESDVREAIAAMTGSDRDIAEKIHEIVKATAPSLMPRTWYGMPAYTKDGKVVCFFQSAVKFKTRYPTFGFQHDANLDDGNMWPVAFAVTKLTAAEEAKLVDLVKRAVS